MIFLKLFIIFTKIGTFNFGGGYAMLSLIHNETVVKNAWLTNSEFTDIVAISQSTPGPIGINAATYVGYTAVLNQGYPEWMAMIGSVLASLSIIWLPFIIMILISRYLMTHRDSKVVKSVFAGLRPAIIGLIAAASLLLMTKRQLRLAERRADRFRYQRCALCRNVLPDTLPQDQPDTGYAVLWCAGPACVLSDRTAQVAHLVSAPHGVVAILEAHRTI